MIIVGQMEALRKYRKKKEGDNCGKQWDERWDQRG